jgi:hypothetical protein
MELNNIIFAVYNINWHNLLVVEHIHQDTEGIQSAKY